MATYYLTLKDWIESYLHDHPESAFNANDIQSAVARMTVRPKPDIHEIQSILYKLEREKKIYAPVSGAELYYKIVV
jgi:hypothetical protein